MLRRLVLCHSLVLAVLILAVTVGCGSGVVDQVEVYKASGVVKGYTTDLAGALVILHPDPSNADRASARGTVDADGRFTLTTYAAGDGAAAGSYTATVVLYRAQDVGGEYQPGGNLLPKIYATTETSPLRVEIKPVELNSLEIELSRK